MTNKPLFGNILDEASISFALISENRFSIAIKGYSDSIIQLCDDNIQHAIRSMNLSLLTKITVIFTVFSLTFASFSYAQQGTYLDDEGATLWEEETFTDVTGQEFETIDRQYVGEEQIKAAEEARKKAGLPTVDIAAAIEKDKQLMPDNIVYGIGTGAVIGGWLALVQGQDARQNVQYLSVGVLVGALIGMLIGTKSLYLPPAQANSLIDVLPTMEQEYKTRGFSSVNADYADVSRSPKFNLSVQFNF
jgi:hypothetical protein